MPQGGVLGFHCAHAYAHTNDRSIRHLPFALKGVDVIVYTVFRSLGLDLKIKPVLDALNGNDYYDGSDGSDGADGDENGELVGTGLHGIQISEEGGRDGYETREVGL